MRSARDIMEMFRRWILKDHMFMTGWLFWIGNVDGAGRDRGIAEWLTGWTPPGRLLLSTLFLPLTKFNYSLHSLLCTGIECLHCLS